MENKNYLENELGKVSDSIKNVKLSDNTKKILSGACDNDFIDKDKFPNNSYWLAYNKASKMINWAELSRTLAGDRSSITNERIPQKHVAKIHELRKSITEWILSNDPQFNK